MRPWISWKSGSTEPQLRCIVPSSQGEVAVPSQSVRSVIVGSGRLRMTSRRRLTTRSGVLVVNTVAFRTSDSAISMFIGSPSQSRSGVKVSQASDRAASDGAVAPRTASRSLERAITCGESPNVRTPVRMIAA